MEKDGGNLKAKPKARKKAGTISDLGKSAGGAAGKKVVRKPKADTGDILANTTTKSQRKLVGLAYPSGKQSKLDVVVHAQSEATQRRDNALSAFDRARAGHLVRPAGSKPVTPRQAADLAAAGGTRRRHVKARRSAVKLAPVLDVLDQTTRPLHGVMGATDAAIRGKNVHHAFTRGIQNKDRITGSDVLKDLGVKNKTVRAIGGFGLDVVGDPTTLTTFGTGTIARKGATKALEDSAKGLTVKFAGKEIPGIRTATGHTVGKVTHRIGKTKGAERVKSVVRDFNPDMAPKGVPKADWQGATSAARRAKATQGRTRHAAHSHGIAVRKAIGKNDQSVGDAIEAKTIDRLPDAQHAAAARHIRDTQHDLHARELAAGIKTGTVKEMHPVAVPEASTAVADSAKALRAAQRARATAQREHQALVGRSNVVQGRAEILSRNVNGSTGERAAERAPKVRARADARAGKTGTPADVLRHIDEVLGPGSHYGGGGLGVARSADELLKSTNAVRAARAHEAATQAAHAENLAGAKLHRVDRALAIRHNQLAAVAPKGYLAHYTNRSLEQGAPTSVPSAVGKRVVNPDNARGRMRDRQRPLAVLRDEHPGVYNEDVALGFANRVAKGEHAIAQAQLNHRLAELGTEVKHGHPVALTPEQGVFHLHGSDLTEITDKAALSRALAKGAPDGERYVVLDRRVVKHAHAITMRGEEVGATGRLYDKTQGAFKFIATQPNPGFHIRNLIGDTQNAYLAQPGHRLPANIVRSGKTLRALKRTEEAQRTLGATAKPIRGSVKIDGKNMSYADLAHEAAHVGAIRSGFTNTELPELLQQGAGGLKKIGGTGKVNRAGRAVKRTIQSREDLPRLTTYIEARRRGMTAEQAAAHAAKFHFDYGNLTNLERKVMRRVVPFYTFSARNIPLQAKRVLTNPGKVANYQKIREEAAAALGLDGDNWQEDLKKWEARNAPVPIRFRGKLYTVSAGLPITDLNEFPTTLNPQKLVDEWFQKSASLVTPLIKDPVELWANYSAFFRGPIERDTAPLVAAPSFVGRFTPAVKKKLGITQIVDKKTGGKVWAWPAKVNYIAHAIPGPQQTLTNLASGTDQAGRGTGAKVISALGVKTAPIDPGTVKINTLYDRVGAIQKRLGALSQQGIKKAHTNAERVRLNNELRVVEREIYGLARARGDQVLPTVGGPRKNSGSAGSGTIGGGIGGGLSSSSGGGIG